MAINSTQVKINVPALKDLAFKNKLSLTKMSTSVGRSDGYLSICVNRGLIDRTTLMLMCAMYGADINDLLLIEKPEKAVDAVPPIGTPVEGMGYTTKIEVQPKKVCFYILFNNVEVTHAWSGIRGAWELDLIQSISYAAHQCYKNMEQKVLEGT